MSEQVSSETICVCGERHGNHVGKPAGIAGKCYGFKAAPSPMIRERLSEEEIGRISRSTPIPETLSVVEDILTARVTAARLAAEAAENEACAKYVEECSLPDSYSEPCLAEFAKAIRSRMTDPQVSALERVKAESRIQGRLSEEIEHGCHSVNCSSLFRNRGTGDTATIVASICNCGWTGRVEQLKSELAALSADRAAKGDGE